jgi:hypothetical protein
MMRRVPVDLKHSRWVPPGFAAWVPEPRTIRVEVGRPLTERLLAHELCHVTQADEVPWPFAYVAQWVLTGFSYRNMPFEVEARRAENEPFYRAWARDLIEAQP